MQAASLGIGDTSYSRRNGGVTVVVNGNLFGAATADDLVELLQDGVRRYAQRGGP